MSEQNRFNVEPIATIESPYKEKFAIPRQPGLVSSAKGSVLFHGEYNNPELLRGIEQYSHLWVIFVFHGTLAQGWKPLVKPPRLGGNTKMGVLATRSTFRPNGIGMSVVKNEGISFNSNQLKLNISALDLLDQTPVLDIKPYIPYADALTAAKSDFAQTAQEHQMAVCFTNTAKQQLSELPRKFNHLNAFISEVLQQDPRPAYKKKKYAPEQEYGMQLYQFNIRWRVVLKNEILYSEVFDIKSV